MLFCLFCFVFCFVCCFVFILFLCWLLVCLEFDCALDCFCCLFSCFYLFFLCCVLRFVLFLFFVCLESAYYIVGWFSPKLLARAAEGLHERLLFLELVLFFNLLGNFETNNTETKNRKYWKHINYNDMVAWFAYKVPKIKQQQNKHKKT